MAKERIITPEVQRRDEPAAGIALRPRMLDEFVGQRELVEKLTIALQASLQRNEPMEHLLLHGPPGLGKTT
ncbi:MAG: Holliday junction branch migration DNA helicase RuvB, partial [Planctomycetota bacterium]|nr:Holliday junction branch migration DNA helicase RuvB [Planctomycetota bacterium]